MSNLMHIFSTGVSGLFASQAGIDVTGNNISNVNTEGYSRQRVVLETANPEKNSQGVFGRGVSVETVERIYDDMLASSIRNESSDLAYYETLQSALSKVTIYFNELEDGSGLGEAMQNYFDAWGDLANTAPDESDEALIKRATLVESASVLADKIQASYASLEEIKNESNLLVSDYVNEINNISENIAYLNKEIARIESGGDTANDFRDQRQVLLNRLAEISNMSVTERSNGQVAVYIGGNAIVDEATRFELKAEQADEDSDDVSIFWGTEGQSNKLVDITNAFTSGEIAGELYVRDELIQGYQDQLDELANVMITETNKIHSLGQGTNRLTQISSSNGVTNPTYTFSEPAGAFPIEIQAGTLRISIYDTEGNKVEDLDIVIDPAKDNLNSVIAKISAADGNPNGGMIQASMSSGNTIKFTSGSGYDFTFAEDTSNFLVASGTYGFFAGSDASTIAVSDIIMSNNSYIATSQTGAAGDNQNAAAIADLKDTNIMTSMDVTVDEFYAYFAASIGSDKATVDIYVTTKTQAMSELELKLEEVKGVSMDEEMTNLMKFQRAFEASSRFITVVDEMLEKLVNSLGTGGR
ncbi:flagellar hook-associated protein FlgK [Denitrovibrio acetiphilus DSM 12809]|uniref:Flagellar hook-associated protein 1 n=1 Tax=Denitrovibrio acetiphilus (strain DSM 12809 / NBRC 114555 / N2460) TaxID=522772 RepID=D4H4A3_DENA2|nr:flagellar hook-associated protein FlgK [Denitrovibrio acetiphilus]ADD69232.1 flagellar hook-associated protein FlgK [Denitrovibrio acetiphilus DSM 12809]